jgi:hypothetical protein
MLKLLLLLLPLLHLLLLLLQRDALEESDMLIYNWKPEYTGRVTRGGEEQDFEQTYIFGPPGNRLAGSRQQQQQRSCWVRRQAAKLWAALQA